MDGIAIVPPPVRPSHRTDEEIIRFVTAGRTDPGWWDVEKDRHCWVVAFEDGWLNMPSRAALHGTSLQLCLDNELLIDLPEGFLFANNWPRWGADWREPTGHFHAMPLIAENALQCFCSKSKNCFLPFEDEE